MSDYAAMTDNNQGLHRPQTRGVNVPTFVQQFMASSPNNPSSSSQGVLNVAFTVLS